jgi:hypothetical protein
VTAGPIAEAALRLVALLDPGQAAAARLEFKDPERVSWHYTPRTRRGLSLADMDRGQAKAAHRLLAQAVSPATYARIAAVVGLEDVLDESEGGGRGRHAGDYWTALFGEPGDPAGWGYRFEGHHVSINVTAVGDGVSVTPCFLGANPAVITVDGWPCVLPLAPEEALARHLLMNLDAARRQLAVVSAEAPRDILTGEAPRADPAVAPPAGIAGGQLRTAQRVLLRDLVASYVGRAPAAVAAAELARLDGELERIHFAWAGEVHPPDRFGPGHPHYYRLHGPGFLVELDNTQNDANHVHSVWRDPEGDFGARLLG